MKLTDIDLNDKSEVAAAHALLAAILGVIKPETGAVPLPSIDFGALQQDPAAVFGGAAAQTPLPDIHAPSTVGVAPLPTALAGMPVSLPATFPVSQMPAAYIAPAVHAQVHASVTPTSHASGVELDKDGLPWDGRIHAGSKTKKQNGAWVAKRGLNDDALVARVTAELRAQSATPLPGNTADPATIFGGAAAQTPLTPRPALLPGINGPASLGEVALPGATSLADPTTFEQIMPRVTSATIAGVLPPTAVQQACTSAGLPSVVALQTNPTFVPHVWSLLKASYPALQ